MPTLRIEHVALNVADPVAMAAWYVEHLGMRVIRKISAPPHIHFLTDAQGTVAIEIYSNPIDPIPDYAAMHTMRLHLALWADDLESTMKVLMDAGATYVDEQNHADGSRLVMLRDPWGLPLQLARRTTPLM